MEQRDEVLTLVDEEGSEHSFEVIDILQVNDREYAILLPLDAEKTMDSEAEDEAIIFRIVDEGEENQTLMAVEDDEEWEEVASAWEERVREFEEEEEDEAFLDDEEEEV